MKLFIALLVLSLCLPAALASGNSSQSVEATTYIRLPVDSVTIYPDGLMSVKRMGSLDVTEASTRLFWTFRTKQTRTQCFCRNQRRSRRIVCKKATG